MYYMFGKEMCVRERKRHDVNIYKLFRGKQSLEGQGYGRKIEGEVGRDRHKYRKRII